MCVVLDTGRDFSPNSTIYFVWIFPKFQIQLELGVATKEERNLVGYDGRKERALGAEHQYFCVLLFASMRVGSFRCIAPLYDGLETMYLQDRRADRR